MQGATNPQFSAFAYSPSSNYRAFFHSCWRSVPHVAPQHIKVRKAQLPARFFAGHCLSACTYGNPGSLDHLPIRSALAYYAPHHLGRSKNPRELVYRGSMVGLTAFFCKHSPSAKRSVSTDKVEYKSTIICILCYPCKKVEITLGYS